MPLRRGEARGENPNVDPDDPDAEEENEENPLPDRDLFAAASERGVEKRQFIMDSLMENEEDEEEVDDVE